jgi:hypothetical protein
MGELLPTYRTFAHPRVENEHRGQWPLERPHTIFVAYFSRHHRGQDALKTWTARQLRLAFMMQTWSAKMDLTDGVRTGMENIEETFNVSFHLSPFVSLAILTRCLVHL